MVANIPPGFDASGHIGLLGIPVITSRLVPYGKAIILGNGQAIVLSIAPNPTRRARFMARLRRWFRWMRRDFLGFGGGAA